MKKILFLAFLLAAFVAPAQTVSTRIYGDTTATNSLIVTSQNGQKAYAFCGYTTTTQYIMVFQTNAVPANGTKATFSVPVTAGQFYSIDFSYYGADLDKCTVCNSTTANTLTIGAADTTFQAIFRR